MAKLHETEQQLAQWRDQQQASQERIDELQRQLAQAKDQIAQLGDAKQQLEGQYQGASRHLHDAEQRIASLETQYETMRKEREALQSKWASAQQALTTTKAEYQQTLTKLKNTQARLAQVQRQSQQALDDARKRLAGCESRRRAQEVAQHQQLDQLETRLSACSGRLTELPVLKQRIVELRSHIEDSDGDGLVDADDRCPGTPTGRPVDASGCEPDQDQDGTPDAVDLCPELAASGGRLPGCPDDTPVRLGGIHFLFNSNQLKPESEAALQQVLDILRAHPDLAVEIAGHTDSIGRAAFNQQLSEARAREVLSWLTAHGIPADRLRAKGYGESQPVADNRSAAGRAANRRVELRVLPAQP